MNEIITIITNNEEETIEAGHQFAKKLEPGNIVLLFGELGSGKTEFVKGICSFFKVDDIITSPTFTIINQYFGEIKGESIPIFHIDLYRIKSQKELPETGFYDFLYAEDAIKIIEWAEKVNSEYPMKAFNVGITTDDINENRRTILISQV